MLLDARHVSMLLTAPPVKTTSSQMTPMGVRIAQVTVITVQTKLTVLSAKTLSFDSQTTPAMLVALLDSFR